MFKKIIKALDNSKLSTFQMYAIAMAFCIIGAFIGTYRTEQSYKRILNSAVLSEAVVTEITRSNKTIFCHFIYHIDNGSYNSKIQSDYRTAVGDTLILVYNSQDINECTAVKIKKGHPILSTKSYKIIKLNNLPQPKRDSLKRSVLAELRKQYLDK